MNRRMTQDLAHKRPYLLASLIAGISFPATWLFLPLDGGLIALVWKMAGVGLLVRLAEKDDGGELGEAVRRGRKNRAGALPAVDGRGVLR